MKLRIVNQTSKRIFVASAIALSVISMSIPISVNANGMDASSKITAGKSAGITVKVSTKDTYTDKSKGYEATIQTPKVTGNIKGLDTLNKKMAAYAKEQKTNYLNDKKTIPNGRKSVSVDYTTVTNSKTVLVIQMNTNITMADYSSYSKYFTLDKRTGKILSLKDLFKKDADYVSSISKDIIEQMKQIMDKDKSKSFFIEREEYEGMGDDLFFSKIKEEQSFYIDKNGALVIAFDKFDVAPGYMGNITFTIRKEAISDILK